MSLGRAIIGLLLAGPGSAAAGIDQAPPAFHHGTAKAVFVDFTSASYTMTVDVRLRRVRVVSQMTWAQRERGHAVFDLVAPLDRIEVDGHQTDAPVIVSPDRATQLRMIERETLAGTHTMRTEHRIQDGAVFSNGKAALGFWMNDLEDRNFLERYLPASFGYDSVAMRIDVQIAGAGRYKVRANGVVRVEGPRDFRIDYPDFFTGQSVFFHLSPQEAFHSLQYVTRAATGQQIPVEVYGAPEVALEAFRPEIDRTLTELERVLGQWPHPSLLVHAGPEGYGMEYSGAAVSSLRAINHELFHSYFGRSVMPANGNSSWLDEALAVWRDQGYQQHHGSNGPSSMAAHSPWMRHTDEAAYLQGRNFVSWIAAQLTQRHLSLQAFLRQFFAENIHSTVTTETFRRQLETFANTGFADAFDFSAYGRRPMTPRRHLGEGKGRQGGCPVHRPLTRAEEIELTLPR